MLRRMSRTFTSTAKNFKGETYKHQDALPSLPVPTIEQTKARYLKSIKPFVKSDEEYNKQVELVDDFFKTQGKELHERLSQLQSKSRNWLSLYWDDYAYLQYMDAIVPYVSYFFGHKRLPNEFSSIDKSQLLKSVALIEKVLVFNELLASEQLPPEVIKNNPFCMESFKYMFNNSRFPLSPGQDSNVFFDGSKLDTKFIIVISKNHFFKLFTHDQSTGEKLSNAEIYKQLLKIQELASAIPENSKSIGALTSLPRDKYYETYQELIKSPLNVSSLNEIYKSIFVLTLDEDLPVTYEQRAHFAWHGNGQNRFFDKPLQFSIAKNGYVGFLGEHSKMDGTPTLLLNEFVQREIRKINPTEFLKSLNKFDLTNSSNTPVKLNFDITDSVNESIQFAKLNLLEELENHDVKVLHYSRFGKKQIKQFKQFKTSPDALLQVIMQLALYKLNNKLWPTYEASATRKFYKGRTEATRSVTPEVLKFVENWSNPQVGEKEQHDNLRSAMNAHVEYIKAATNGEGVDRHFLGMKLQLKEGEKPHALLQDPIFNYSGTWYVSTSQLSSNFLDAWGWAEVNPIGWGLAYSITDDFLHFNIATRKSSGNSSELLAHYMSESADEVYELLIKQTEKPKL